MKSATVQSLETEPLEVLSWVEKGEEVEILRDGVAVARLLPPLPEVKVSPNKPRTKEEIRRYLENLPYPEGPYCEVTGAELVSWDRGDY